MASNDAPIRTTEALVPVPDFACELVASISDAEDLPVFLTDPGAPLVPEPQDAPVLRWGILGAGGIAGTFADSVSLYSSGVIAAVGSRDKAKAQAFIDAHPEAHRGGVPKAYGSYEDLVCDIDVDAIYVATPHSHHAQYALMAIEAGKHVLVEKAFTVNASQARAIFDAARARGVFVMEAMWTRFLPGQVLVRALAHCGALGEIRYVRAEHFQRLTHVPRLMRPELAGGALLDLGVYSMSFVHSILAVPTDMDVRGSVMTTDTGVIDTLDNVTMHYPHALANAVAGMETTSPNTAEIQGTRATVTLGSAFYTPTTITLKQPFRDGGREESWDGCLPGGFQFQAAEVARCVAAGRQESSVMPWRSTLEVMELMDQVRSVLGVTLPGD